MDMKTVTFGLFDENSSNLYIDERSELPIFRGFFPSFRLLNFHPEEDITDRKLHFILRNEDPQKFPTREDYDMLQLREGTEQLLERLYDDKVQEVIISPTQYAMHEGVAFYIHNEI